ncbi:hypothetical protein O181_009403 [Austropuccinia psidii MF-1]|uniref:Retrotransposon gag domain-containing protein n=1 Tax=Austropuccinia psidii MF-1 TaxID=1389203 RepID=A0A9Q3GJE9_9BASI|nr:hypothetical protein [Austropuccinia psidii MF-1]
MKPQPQGHAFNDPDHHEDIKPDVLLGNKAISQSQYQNRNDMSYSEKEALRKLPEAFRLPKLSGTGEYDHMELICYIDGLFIDLPSISDFWITARINTSFKEHASIWYAEMKEIHGGRKWPWWKSHIIQKFRNCTGIWQKTMSFENDKYSVDKDLYECCLRKSKIFKAIDPQMNIQMRNHKLLTQLPGELEHAKKVYAIEQVPEEESPTEDSESDSIVDAIREQSDDDQDPREAFLVEYQEETQREIQEIQLEEGMPPDFENKNLCSDTQDAQIYLVTPTKQMAYIHGTATNMIVYIHNAQDPLIIGSGAHCSIVARTYLDVQIGKHKSFQPRQKNFKSESGR